ncbi:MAG: UbiA family prenyltransferase [Deltaproteobacteria bacterium]|nr:UbiA family prenyltransferase [Deltaproteobacteria bacterium]MCB9489036.1 UbiA family prenyltransferase [Deltaproteobacteria bacterium]
MISGGITALGADPFGQSDWTHPGWLVGAALGPTWLKLVWYIAVGALMAAMLNAASNALNQITDLTNDRVNKPGRPIPSGRMSIREAWGVTGVFYAIALALSFLVNWQCFLIVVVASFFIYGYSAEPFRTKRRGWWANFTIAIPRGILLKVAGWSTVKHVGALEPWYIGLLFGLFLLGASSTKDFSDMEGDAADGCQTLPVKYGVKSAAWMIAPFFVLPFPLIPAGVHWGILTGNAVLLYLLGIGLSLWGCYTVYLILRDPNELAATENHISWKHMYLMMMGMQIGFALAYVI